MCIKESLRLYPLGPLTGKKLSKEITAGGYRIPKGMLYVHNELRLYSALSLLGTYIGLDIYVMHRDPAVWSDPEVNYVTLMYIIILVDVSTEI